MSSSNSTSDYSTVHKAFLLQKNDILVSNSTRYLIMDFNGEGSFGKVAKCLNLTTCNTEVVKIHTNSDEELNQREVEMLEAVKALDPEKNNIVRFMESFRFNDLSCLVFERLDKSLHDLMKERKFMPLSLNEIRPVIHQLLVALDALKDISVVHTDLKPDNIMLVNHKHQPYKVKLIDFGLAHPLSQLEVGMAMQARSFRAPEVMLGLPLSEAVDMWGLGCVTAFLYFGMNLFPGNCEYHWMKTMMHLLGQPEDHSLSAGIYSLKYFSKEEGSGSPEWRLKSPEEYRTDAGVIPIVAQRFGGKTLEGAVQRGSKKRDALEEEDLMAFSSLLRSFLHLDPTQRITPKEALKHPFFTMTHLVNEKDTNSYAGEAHQLMAVCRTQYSDGPGDSLTHSEPDMESDPRAFKTDLQRESSSASVSENDSLTESFSCYDGDTESVSDESSDMDSYTARHSGARSFCGYDADIESESATTENFSGRNEATDRDVPIEAQRDLCLGSIWDLDEFTETFSGRNEATDRDVPIKTQRDLCLGSLWDLDEFTETFSGRNEATDRDVPIEAQRDLCLGSLWDLDEFTETFSGRNEATDRDVPIEAQRDLCLGSLWDLDEFTETFSGRNEATDRDVPIKTQRDLCLGSLWDLDEFTETFSGRNEATDRDIPIEAQRDLCLGSLWDLDEFTETFSGRNEATDRDVPIKTQRDLCLGSLWDLDEFTETFSGRNEATDRDVPIEAQRDLCLGSLWDLDEFTETFSGRNEATDRDVPIEAQRDLCLGSFWDLDEFTENFSGRNDATGRYVPIKTQRDPCLCEEDGTTGPHNTNNRKADITEQNKTFQLRKDDVLVSNSTSYHIIDFIGEGCFGKVARCFDLTTYKTVAVKIHTGNDEYVIQCEVDMLAAISILDPEKNNITQFLESFRFKGLSCLAFEMLDRSLWDLMLERRLRPMRLNEIRPVFQQLLVAFDALKGINMLHTDLKPDNIMLVNQNNQPYRVKLIDFGLARPVSELWIGEIMQPVGYRAPEVMLGLRSSEAIDMWGVGCVMASLCFGRAMLFGECEYDWMKFMVELLGLPDDHMLKAGIHSSQYFSRVEGSSSPGWRLKSPEEYKKATGVTPQLSSVFFNMFRDLEEAVKSCQQTSEDLEDEDAMAFLSLLKSCLHLDPTKRFTPKQALEHPFITMSHLVNKKYTDPYAVEAHTLMAVCFRHH